MIKIIDYFLKNSRDRSPLLLLGHDISLFLLSLSIVSIVTTVNANAETYEEYKKRTTQQYQKKEQQFEEFRSTQQKKFYSHLKEQWENFRVFAGRPEDSSPKPQTIPQVRIKKITIDQVVTPKALLPETRSTPKPKKSVPLKTFKTEPSAGLHPVEMSFFSRTIVWQTDNEWQKWHLTPISRIDQSGIADYWKKFSVLQAQVILNQLDETAKRMNLNDWGKIKLLDSFAKSLNLSENQQLLTSWALLNQAGYDVRVGYTKQRVYLLYHSLQKLYSLPYFRFDNKRYYLYRLTAHKPRKIKSYKGELVANPKALNLRLKQPLRLYQQEKERRLSLVWKNKKYEFSVPLYRQQVSYLNSLPQQQLKNYFIFRPNEYLKKTLFAQLEEVITPMQPIEKIDFLLRFVQTAFEYATDDQQFSYENYLLPDETMYYPASDCEDRAILFTWLITHLTPYKLVVLDYPGHVATAIALPKKVWRSDDVGKTYSLDGVNYVVADPTYINATIGMEMPQFSQTTPELFSVPTD